MVCFLFFSFLVGRLLFAILVHFSLVSSTIFVRLLFVVFDFIALEFLPTLTNQTTQVFKTNLAVRAATTSALRGGVGVFLVFVFGRSSSALLFVVVVVVVLAFLVVGSSGRLCRFLVVVLVLALLVGGLVRDFAQNAGSLFLAVCCV